MEPEVEDCIKLYTQKLEHLAQSGAEMNLQFWMQYYAFDVISQITVSQSSHSKVIVLISRVKAGESSLQCYWKVLAHPTDELIQ